MAKLESTDLENIIPKNLLEFKEIADICETLRLPVAEVTGNIYYDAIFAHLDAMPEEVIDLLGWQWHVDYYDSSAKLEVKRELVKQSLDWHRRKGTKYAVNGILKTIAPGYHIEEWNEYGGDPYYFRIIETGGEKVDYSDKELIKAVNSVKNVRSWLDYIVMDSGDTEPHAPGTTIGNEFMGYPSGKHTAEAEFQINAEQGYWIDSTFMDLYWNGYHWTGGEGPQYNKLHKLDGSIQYNGTWTKHNHYFDDTLEYTGREWVDARGNKQKHDVGEYFVVTPKLSATNKGYKYNGKFQYNGILRYDNPKKLIYWHTATCTTIKGDTKNEEAI